ncbi:MAG TPA: aliphatic sulfonate ABC transporter substrate-binding protein [Thermomicrobiales bacterium]|nr:aliphatic sulfonate ABC transporter substrate-binding protein [Thermomicrobiales bacterium]
MIISRRDVIQSLVALGVIPVLGRTAGPVSAQEQPATVRVDYAYYNPSSLVLRRFGWLEEALQEQGIGVEWVLSAGSNKANEYLRSEAIDFGSTAGAAALLARANGSPIKTVYIYSKPEWAALVVPADSPITAVADLKGKKIAATKGTDPYFFLLRSLNEAGLSGTDVEVVNLQHADGRTALERGDVDAWAGLDPHMAASELEAGSKLLYRNIDFNTYGFLNANEEFITQYPELTATVLQSYERARQWILENPDEAAQILAEEAKISTEVAERELFERTVLDIDPVPGETHAEVLRAVIPIFVAENQVKPGTDVEAVLAELLAPEAATSVVTAAEPAA